MEKDIEIYNEKEKCNIRAKKFFCDLNGKEDQIFIFCHGFCSGKESNSIKVVANTLLQQGIPSISFNFPGHMDSMQGIEKLKVDVCISYINSIIEYTKEIYGKDIRISFYAISFGAYVLLNKLIGDTEIYENIVLRSPAINMRDILIHSLLKDSFEQYKKNGNARAGYKGRMKIPYSFYEDLVKHNLYDNYNEKRNIIIIQGNKDDTAPIEDTYKFIQNKPECELIEMENVGHHMEPKEIELSTKMLLRYDDWSKCPVYQRKLP